MNLEPGPLAGLRILDLSRLLPGPMATRHLADLGAQVLKVEPPSPQGAQVPGDDAAFMGAAADGVSYFYRVVNHGKRRLVLDLKSHDGLARLHALVAQAHALVEGFRPGVMARLGLSHEALAAINPGIVLTSISGYGQTGALRNVAGHDINYLALSGIADQTRGKDGQPALSHLQMADLLGGAQSAAIGTLAGVVGALMNGRGRWVDVPMTDALRQHLVIAGAEALAAGVAPVTGSSLLNGGVPCYNFYRTRDDRWLAVGALELKFWQALCDTLDKPAWRDRHWSLGEAPGSTAARALTAEVAAELVREDQSVWLARVAGVDCCVTPVLDAYSALFGTGTVSPEQGLALLCRPAMRATPADAAGV